MRIAIIADSLDNQRAGVHVYTRNLVEALDADHSEHEYILIREKVDPNLAIRQIAIANVHLPIGFASFRLFFIIPIILRRLKVDVVFEPAHFGPFNLPKRIKRVTMIHDLTPILFPNFHRYHSQLLQNIFLKRILKKADLVLSNSKNTTADLERVFPITTGKIKTIHLGKEAIFRPSQTRDFFKLHNITAPYFLYVGTIEPRKNLSFLLEAFEQFRRQNEEEVKLIIVGQKGWKSEDFYRKLESNSFRKDIMLTGFVEKRFLPELYTHSLALIYPSIYEGFGLPVLEAMACGTNVICPKNSSLVEVGGEIALYFEFNDVDSLLNHMLLVSSKGPLAMVKRMEGIKWANRFSWEAYAKQFELGLSSLMKVD